MPHRFLLLIASLLILSSPARAVPSPDDQAKFLAGLKMKHPGLTQVSKTAGWTAHAASLEKKWTSMENRQLAAARQWAAANPALNRGSGAVFYPFSGPDFLYAFTLFPKASTYILCGTEPIGSVPDITQMPLEQVNADLTNLRTALDTMLATHYFITKDMRADLSKGTVHGTLPLLYLFLARTGCILRQVEVGPTRARIQFSGRNGKKQTLYYFKTDLSNGGGHGALLALCQQHSPGATLVKSASYLLHSDEFSSIRNFLLSHSAVIIQDDTGIPYRFFDPGRWNVKLYGTYRGPIDMFQKYHQADLAAAYANTPGARLGFAFGYSSQISKGVLLQATRK